MTDEEKKKTEEELKNTPVDDPKEPSTDDPSDADPKPDTGDDPDTPADPAEVIDEYQKKFIEKGLDKQFANPLEVFDRVPDFNVHADNLHKRNLALEQELAGLKKAKPPETEKLIEEFDVNPLNALKQAGVATVDDVSVMRTELDGFKQREILRNFADSMSPHPELKNIVSTYRIGRQPVRGMNPYWDKMNELMKDYPGLETADPSAIVQILLPEAKKLVNPRTKPPVNIVPDEDKLGANSSTPKKTRTDGTPNYAGMTADEIKKDYARRGLLREHY